MMNKGRWLLKVLSLSVDKTLLLQSLLPFSACFLFPAFSFAQNSEIQKLKVSVQKRIDTYLDKTGKLGEYYSLTDEGMLLYASPAKKAEGKTETEVKWTDFLPYVQRQQTDLYFQQKASRAISPIRTTNRFTDRIFADKKDSLPLSGLRIAIDPGHLSGDLAAGKIEQKYIQIDKDSLHGIPQDIELVEGHLTLGTALILRKKLQAAGATVMMTHDKPDMTSLGKTFEEWLQTDFNHALDSLVANKDITKQQKLFYKTRADKRKIFRDIFRDIELKARAEQINAFKPDFTVIIHYNVDETNVDWKKLSDKDFVMTFIGGGMLPSDLNKADKRAEFLRLALTDDLDKSEKISAAVLKSFHRVLKVPIASKKDATYLRDNCLATANEGVYCRNLILTRIVHSPLVYGETLYQDNKNECFALMKEDDEIEGIRTSARVREVAEAYFEGVMAYCKK
jgi:N-acetylmuramoyl-L-alanine amidase